MSSLPSVPRHPVRPGAAAGGQVLALALVALVALPLLPVVLLVAAWIRLRDRFDRPAPAARPVSAPPSAAHAA